MQIVPIQAVPNQTFAVLLGTQQCTISINTRIAAFNPKMQVLEWDTYLSMSVNNIPALVNQRCLNTVLLVRYAYLGFSGDLWFFDTQGSADPFYTGFGSRFLLEYIEPADFAAAALAAAAAA